MLICKAIMHCLLFQNNNKIQKEYIYHLVKMKFVYLKSINIELEDRQLGTTSNNFIHY